MNTQDRLVQRSAFRGLIAPFLYLNMFLIT